MAMICIRVATALAMIAVVEGSCLGAGECTTSSQLADILAELQKIRSLIETSQTQQVKAPLRKSVSFEFKGGHLLGAEDAPVTIVAFIDYQCPYCRQFYRQTFRDLKSRYIDEKRARFYLIDLPIDSHANALLAAESGRCAEEFGHFWPMHDRMLTQEWSGFDDLIRLAGNLGIDRVQFRQCVESGKYRGPIQSRAREATRVGVEGTPAFIVGKSTPAGVEGELVIGAQSYGVFQELISRTTP